MSSFLICHGGISISFQKVLFRWNILERMISKNGTNKRVPKTNNTTTIKQTKQNKQTKTKKIRQCNFFLNITLKLNDLVCSTALSWLQFWLLVVSVFYWWNFIWVSIYNVMLRTSVSKQNQFLIKPWRYWFGNFSFGFIKMEYAIYWCSYRFLFLLELKWVKWCLII